MEGGPSEIQPRPSAALEKLVGAKARGQRGACGAGGTKSISRPGRMLCPPDRLAGADSRALPHAQVARSWTLQKSVLNELHNDPLSWGHGYRLSSSSPIVHYISASLPPLGPECPLGARCGARRSPCR